MGLFEKFLFNCVGLFFDSEVVAQSMLNLMDLVFSVQHQMEMASATAGIA